MTQMLRPPTNPNEPNHQNQMDVHQRSPKKRSQEGVVPAIAKKRKSNFTAALFSPTEAGANLKTLFSGTKTVGSVSHNT